MTERGPLTVKDVAELAGVHEHTVRRAIRAGHLEAFRRRGSSVLQISPDAFDRWIYGERVEPDEEPADVAPSPSRAKLPAGSLADLAGLRRGKAA